jgi:hypothetical protein
MQRPPDILYLIGAAESQGESHSFDILLSGLEQDFKNLDGPLSDEHLAHFGISLTRLIGAIRELVSPGAIVPEDEPLKTAAAYAFVLGHLMGNLQLRAFDEDILRGIKIQDSARKGAEVKHGPKADRDAQHQIWQQELDRIAKEKHLAGTWYNHEAAKRSVARKYGCSPSTIKAHTKNPRPRGTKISKK